ncbi:MAG: paraquat-inducible protein A, partial [Bdellovibrionaceae bacterium]|nr:paraquat-inducible protein A [Pseudobdellovibrionaceae bacterium]
MVGQPVRLTTTQMKKIKVIISVCIVIACAVLCGQIISTSIDNQQTKLDYVEINHIKYGLFSINKWKEKLTKIVFDEIDNFDLDRQDQKILKKQVAAQLNGLIDKVVNKIKEKNKGSIGGAVKQTFFDVMIDVNSIKEGIPEYADSIVKELNKPRNEKQIKGMLKKQLNKYLEETFDEQDQTKVNAIIAKTGTTDIESARAKINQQIELNRNVIVRDTWLLIALALALFVMSGMGKLALSVPQYSMLLITLLMLLFTGVITPMIDLEARIAEMSFVLMGHPVSFLNQVLYFQSKSIIDVFWVMLIDPAIQMKAVGILMVSFSIVFPVLKLISSALFYFNYKGSRQNRAVRFLLLKTGKWSMADVFVVAMFMAYIGFNGVIANQFGNFTSAGAGT